MDISKFHYWKMLFLKWFNLTNNNKEIEIHINNNVEYLLNVKILNFIDSILIKNKDKW